MYKTSQCCYKSEGSDYCLSRGLCSRGHSLKLDVPSYAIMQYSLAQPYTLNNINYAGTGLNYDSINKQAAVSEISPIEIILPKHKVPFNDNSNSKSLYLQSTIPKSIIDEIEQARKMVLDKEVIIREIEEVVLLRKTRMREVLFRETRIE